MPDFEWVIVNDASTDKTPAILNDLCIKDKRIRVITNTENCGLSASRRIGINACSSDLVTFLDADDYFYYDALEQYMRAVRLKYADIYICDSKLRIPPGININFNTAAKGVAFRSHNTISGFKACMHMFAVEGVLPNVWDKLYRRSLLVKHAGSPIQHNVGEDLILNARLLINAELVTAIHKSCYVWRYNGLGQKYFLDGWQEYVCTVDTLLAGLPAMCSSTGIDRQQVTAMLAMNYFYCMRDGYMQRKRRGDTIAQLTTFLGRALSHPVMSYFSTEKYKDTNYDKSVNTTMRDFDAYLRSHKKYYIFTRLLDCFCRHNK